MEPNSLKSSIIFGNIRGFFPDYNPYKKDLIYDLANNHNAGIILLTESHLNSNISDDLLANSGWSVFRTDRSKRMCGGVLCLASEEFPVGSKLTFSTSYCEVIGIYFSSLNILNITIYRPPDCPYEHFATILEKCRQWITELEQSGIRPIILLNGDFNFRFLTTWSIKERTSFMESIENREVRGANISMEKKQAFDLCSFVQDHFMEQYIDTYTRGKNFLDLVFCSDDNLIIHNTPLDNVIISDHMLCVLNTNITMKPINKSPRTNIYSTTICDYNLMNATPAEWNSLNEYYNNINWDEMLQGSDIVKDGDLLIDVIEKGVKSCMRPISNHKTSKNAEGISFKSKNLIPHNVRSLFKRKSKLSKSYRTCKTINRSISLRKKILVIDIKLKSHY